MNSPKKIEPGFSPRPVTIHLRPGQKLTIIGTDDAGDIPDDADGAGQEKKLNFDTGRRSSDSSGRRKLDRAPRKSWWG